MKAKLRLNGVKKVYKVTLIKELYANNEALALEAVDSEGPFATLSVNLPGSGSLPKNQCYFKTYSENEGFLEQLEAQKLVKRVGSIEQSIGAPLVEVLF